MSIYSKPLLEAKPQNIVEASLQEELRETLAQEAALGAELTGIFDRMSEGYYNSPSDDDMERLWAIAAILKGEQA